MAPVMLTVLSLPEAVIHVTLGSDDTVTVWSPPTAVIDSFPPSIMVRSETLNSDTVRDIV